MKKCLKILLIGLIVLISKGQVLAETCVPPEEIENFHEFCWLNGETITASNVCWTSSYITNWSIGIAYPGNCRKYPEIDPNWKKKIYTEFESLFKKYPFPTDSEMRRSFENREDISNEFYVLIYKMLDKQFQKRILIWDEIFTYLQQRLVKEHQKGIQKASLDKMAIYHFAASIIEYDYRLKALDDWLLIEKR